MLLRARAVVAFWMNSPELPMRKGGTYLQSTTEVLNWTASASLRAGMERFVKSDLMARSRRGGLSCATRHAGFLRECDFWTDEELRADPVYYELLCPAGLGRAAATAFPLPTGDKLYLSLEPVYDRGPVESAIIQQLDALRALLAAARSCRLGSDWSAHVSPARPLRSLACRR